MNPNHPPSFLESHIKPHAAPIISAMFTSILWAATMLFNYSGQSQHAKDVQVAQGAQIEDNRQQLKNLQEQVNKEDSIIAVVGQFKEDTTKRLDRIEGLLLRDLRQGQQPAR